MNLIKKKIEKTVSVEQERGIALVITIILIGISLLVSLGVSDVLINEFSFSIFSQKSSKAFYAADSGMECASYWDMTGTIFLAPSDVQTNYGGTLPNSTDTVCLSLPEYINTTWHANSVTDIGGVILAYTVIFDLEFDDNRCVKVSVKKDEEISTGDINTTIESYGYEIGLNTSNESDFSNLCGSNSVYPNREERVLKSTTF